jgi:Squalene-hopene cyclase C-terminal domain
MKPSAGVTTIISIAFVLAGVITFVGLSGRGSALVQAKIVVERDAIQKSVDLLERSAQHWPAACASCHHQALQVVTAEAARSRGFRVNQSFLRDQRAFIQDTVAKSQARMRDAIGLTQDRPVQVGPNPDMIFGYSLLGLAESHMQPTPVTDTTVRYLLLLQDKRGNWQSRVKQRPPFEASDFTATALMIRVIREYAPSDRTSQAERAIGSAASWLNSAEVVDTEDRSFRLVGLYWAGAETDKISHAGNDLLAQQRADGGWGQLGELASDAYATGESLLALRTAGIVDENNAQFRRGVDFLLRTQHSDGSWYVKSRAKPIQNYFETGFPYGTDQFISYTATCFATLAILSDDPSREGALH